MPNLESVQHLLKEVCILKKKGKIDVNNFNINLQMLFKKIWDAIDTKLLNYVYNNK